MDELIKIDKCLEWAETVLTEPNNLNKETIDCIEYFKQLLHSKRDEVLFTRQVMSNVKGC